MEVQGRCALHHQIYSMCICLSPLTHTPLPLLACQACLLGAVASYAALGERGGGSHQNVLTDDACVACHAEPLAGVKALEGGKMPTFFVE